MSQLSAVLRKVEGGLAFRCVGCNDNHVVNLEVEGRPKWHWDGDLNTPTLSPSILYRSIRLDLTEAQWATYDQRVLEGSEVVLNDPEFRYVCHFFLRAGKLEYLADCTHAFAGQIVDLAAW